MIADLSRLHEASTRVLAATDGLDFPSRLAAFAFAGAVLISRDVPEAHRGEARALLIRQLDNMLALIGTTGDGEPGRPS